MSAIGKARRSRAPGIQVMTNALIDRRPLVTARDVARILCCSDKEVYKMAARGDIPCIRITSRIVRFDLDDIEVWLASKKQLANA